MSTFLILLLTGTIIGSVFIVKSFYSHLPEMLASVDTQTEQEPTENVDTTLSTPPTTEKQELEDEQKQEFTEIIANAQDSVFTVFTPYSQGSGFLYNNNGAVVTNAHVVEGETVVYIKTTDGAEYAGTIIGYSNETDVAVIQVPDLVGKEPFALEVTEPANIGEEVITLGSPLGLENTATMGYITGKDRNFVIEPYTYENLYQISAPISPGSSGGPLISKTNEKIVAINSAESIEDAEIGFSIPLYTVQPLIDSWINQPMNEEEVLAQFYDANGDSYYGDTWGDGNSGGYFHGGDYTEDGEYNDYWEYSYEDFWSEIGDALKEYIGEGNSYYKDWFDNENYESYEEDWSDPESFDSYQEEPWNEGFTVDENMYYDEATGEWSYYDEQENQWYYYDSYEGTWTYYNETDGLWYYYDEATEQYLPYE